MKPVTLVMAYYENAGMLAEQFKRIRELPKDIKVWLSVVIVDDGSPKSPAVGEDLKGVNLQIFRMDQDIRWNQDACRNIGVRHANTTWVLMTDMDHIVTERTWDYIVKHKHDPTKVYKLSRVSAPDMSPYKPHPNTWLLTKQMFDKAGGYDERFAGYYGTDADIRNRFAEASNEIVLLKETIIRVPREVIPDASTTTYARKTDEDKAVLPKLMSERKMRREGTKQFLFPYHKVV